MTMSMTYKEDPYKKGFGPFIDNVHRVEFPIKKFDVESLNIDPKEIACRQAISFGSIFKDSTSNFLIGNSTRWTLSMKGPKPFLYGSSL